MKKNALNLLSEAGQSVWLDNINRAMFKTGKLENLIEKGLKGMTSNPAIFNKAISQSSDYDEEIRRLCGEGKTLFEIYDELTVKDIKDAASLFAGIYKKTNGLDGYVSLEIDPNLAFDADKTVKEGIRLKEKINVPNLMLKVPATEEGFKAVEDLTAMGINVNITLIFSIKQYIKASGAYIKGLKRRSENNKDISKINSVASVFVSRIDSVVDSLLEDASFPSYSDLKGCVAVANASMIYAEYLNIFNLKEFNILKQKQANKQRVLWASTSTKNENYSDIKYVEELVAMSTVNTIPENTLNLFLDHGKIKNILSSDTEKPEKILENLKLASIDVDRICLKLLDDGISAFINSFNKMMDSINQKASETLNIK